VAVSETVTSRVRGSSSGAPRSWEPPRRDLLERGSPRSHAAPEDRIFADTELKELLAQRQEIRREDEVVQGRERVLPRRPVSARASASFAWVRSLKRMSSLLGE